MKLTNKQLDLITETTWTFHNKGTRFPRDWRRLVRNLQRRRKNFLSVDRPKVFPHQTRLFAYNSATERESGKKPDASRGINTPWLVSSIKEYVRIWTINNNLKV